MRKYYALRQNNRIDQGYTTLPNAGMKDFLHHQKSLLLLWIPRSQKPRYNYEKLAHIFRHLGQLLTVGVPFVTALQTLIHETDDPVITILCHELSYRLKIQGETLNDALRFYAHIFPSFVFSHIHVDETTGTLSDVLIHLSGIMEDLAKQKVMLKKIHHYLSMVGGSVAGTMLTLIYNMAPFVADMYQETNQIPSFLTHGLIHIASTRPDKIVVTCLWGMGVCGVLFLLKQNFKGGVMERCYNQSQRYWGRKFVLTRLRA